MAQQAAIDEDAEARQDVTLPTWSGNGPRRLEGAAASAERRSTEFAPAASTDWHADG